MEITELDEGHVADLMALFAQAWWAKSRTHDDVRQMLANSDIVAGLARPADGRLLAFARVLTDFTYLALILDVVVAADARGHGLGAQPDLMGSYNTHDQGVPQVGIATWGPPIS
ncbi:N-acetyltransferase [Actinomycetes bacterium KLBMP 9797]